MKEKEKKSWSKVHRSSKRNDLTGGKMYPRERESEERRRVKHI